MLGATFLCNVAQNVTEDLLEWKVAAPIYKIEINGRGTCCSDQATISIRKSWH
jgi:hypothetical protein